MWALLVPALIGALAAALGSLLGRALLVLGIGFTTYTGITLAITAVKTQAISAISSIGGDALGLIGYLWLDKGLTLIFSAIVSALAMKAIGGSVKKMVLK
jgi:predicted naringenin-chalcone synthase